MKIVELLGGDQFKTQMDAVKRQEKALKVKKARVDNQRTQHKLQVATACASQK